MNRNHITLPAAREFVFIPGFCTPYEIDTLVLIALRQCLQGSQYCPVGSGCSLAPLLVVEGFGPLLTPGMLVYFTFFLP